MADYQNKKKLLWVDDDRLILSAAKRLCYDHRIQVDCTESPAEALSWIQEREYSVIIADQKMPQITGLEVLKKSKELRPYATRIMITGFLSSDLIEEAVNTCGVFRFINKPWKDEEVVADILQGEKFHFESIRKEELKKQVRIQNKELVRFNEDLEGIVFERTKKLALSKKELEVKNNKVNQLIEFIQYLNSANSLSNLLMEFRIGAKKSGFNIHPMLSYEVKEGERWISFFHKEVFISKPLESSLVDVTGMVIQDKLAQSQLAQILARPVTSVFSVPLPKFSRSQVLKANIFIEHNMDMDGIKKFEEFVADRIQVFGMAVDRMLTVGRVQLASAQWERTFDTIQAPVSIVDSNFNLLRFNRGFDKFSKITSGEEQKNINTSISSLQVSKTEVGKEGEKYELYTYPIFFNEGGVPSNFVNYYLNVTDKRKLYSEVIQSEKMAALGLLAGNIAHELNNPLTGIRSLSQVLLSEKEIQENPINEDLIEIEKASVRCQKIIQDFLDYSQNKPSDKNQKSDINKVVKRTVPLLKTSMRDHNVSVDLEEANMMVALDSSLLQQIVFNLIHNACQAMNPGGNLWVSTEDQGAMVCLRVKDNGPGIPEDVKNKIFEPFYTTKPEGKGTGLGLYVCLSIVEKHQGYMKLTSEVGEGTTFEVYLPKVKAV